MHARKCTDGIMALKETTDEGDNIYSLGDNGTAGMWRPRTERAKG